MHIRLGFPMFLPILDNSISHTQYQPVGNITRGPEGPEALT